MLRSICLLAFVCLFQPLVFAAEPSFPLGAKRILFLGDSITHAGHYVNWVETQLRLQGVDPLPELINIGLSSETCSGLSEPGHPFPRPDVHERLDRALAKTKPDVVVACYGMNDGIYHPRSEKRLAAYQKGVNRLIEKSTKAGAKVILMTPPPFDSLPLKAKGKLKPLGEKSYAYFAMYENYDEVLAQYSDWVRKQNERVEMVIDLRSPLVEQLAAARKENPAFTFAPDGIHPNKAGHRVMAEAILNAWGISSSMQPAPELLAAIEQKNTLLHYAWLSHVGHKRPGVKEGMPLKDALAKAEAIETTISTLVAKARQPKTSLRKSGGGIIHEVHYPPTVADNELRIAVDYFLWVPSGVKKIRGVIVHQHGCGPGASIGGRTAADDLHWQALARKHDCALMGSSYEPRKGINCRLWCDPRNGSGDRFLQSLAHFANASEHQELAKSPWCLWGHSGGGFWASLMQAKHPQRIVAIWLRSGTAYPYWKSGEIEPPELPAAAYEIPVMGNPGIKEKTDERFHRAWDGLTAMQAEYRKHGAFFEFAPDPNSSHDCGNSRFLAILYFDFWLKHRLPTGDSHVLRPTKDALDRWKEELAPKVEQYVRDGSVADDTPPPAPQNVLAKRNDGGWVTVTWQATADFESGIGGFEIRRAGEVIGRLPEKKTSRFGRALFQGLSYHDTPNEPLPLMQFVDKSAPSGETPVYSVTTVNSVNRKSKPTTSK